MFNKHFQTHAENINISSQVAVLCQALAATVAASWRPTETASGLPQVLFICLLYLIHHFQALTDQPYLPLHVGHRTLHPPHLLLQGNGNGSVVFLPGFILLPQLLVAVVLCLRAMGENGPTPHVARLTPMLAVARVGVQVPAEELCPATLIRTWDEFIQAAHGVTVLFWEGEGLRTTADLILTLSEGKCRQMQSNHWNVFYH